MATRAKTMKIDVLSAEKMNTKGKLRRRRRGRAWVQNYAGPQILHAYKRKFRIPIATAINDLESLGVRLDDRAVAEIRVNLHYNNVQHMPADRLARLEGIVRGDRTN